MAEGVTGKKQTIAVCSAVGGVGRTTVTVNLASIMVQKNLDVHIIDGDLQFGDLAMALDIHPACTIKDAAEQNRNGSPFEYFAAHSSGLRLLAAPPRPEYAEIVTTDIMQSIMEAMALATDILFIETQAGLTEQSLQIIENADTVLIVTTPSMAALKNTSLMIETLHQLGFKDKLSVIVNRSTANKVVSVKEIHALIKLDDVFFLPEDTKYAGDSLDLGIPFVTKYPKRVLTKSFESIANQFIVQNESISKQSLFFAFLRRHLNLNSTRMDGKQQ